MQGSRASVSRFWATMVIGLGLLPFAWVTLSELPGAEPKAETKGTKDQAATPAAEGPKPEPQQAKTNTDPAKDDKKKPAGVNPLSNLIKKILPGEPEQQAGKADTKDTEKKNAEKAKPEQETPAPKQRPAGKRARKRGNPPPPNQAADGDEDAGTERARDHIDSRAPQDVALAKLYRRAVSAVNEKNWAEALEIIQNLLDPATRGANGNAAADSLIRLADGRWVSVQAEAVRLLSQMPGEDLERYRREYGPKADVLLKDAEEHHDLQGIVSVATRFFHTQAGQHAANYLGTYHFDRGEFSMAARWYLQLAAVNSPIVQEPKWRLKAAFSLRQSGRQAEAAAMLKESGAGPEADLEVGGKRIHPTDWLRETRLPEIAQPEYEDWRMQYGSPSRTGTAIGGEPLLLERWSVPTTYSKPIIEQLEILREDLSDAGSVPIPASMPLTVDGKVIFRTMRGVQVVDALTGQDLWSTEEGISPERMLAGSLDEDGDYIGRPAGPAFAFRRGGFPNMRMRGGFSTDGMYAGNGPDTAPLTNLLYRDGNYGIVSSDGDQLFVIEDHALMMSPSAAYGWNQQVEQVDPYHRDWSSNRLVSYDLHTGRPLWDVGGREMNEPFDPPLAGNYFFGAPVVDGNELYIIGEKQGEVRLFALDPALGVPLWSQLIAYSDAPIEQDLGRRWFSTPIAVSNGVLLCPTTLGWLVAVDRLKHTVLWAHRYTPPSIERQPNPPNGTFVRIDRLSQYWCPSAPIVVGNRVVFAPSEEQILVCVDLFDGSLLWKKSKGNNGLYVAGVIGDNVVVVGTRSIVSYSIADGTTLWSTSIQSDEGSPSGVGVAVGNRYYLPLNSGALWTIDMKDGAIVERTPLREGMRPMGNLAMSRGMLVSLDALEVRCFERKDTVEGEIHERKIKHPGDFAALMREADIAMLHQDNQSALKSLRQISLEGLSNEQVARRRTKMIESLEALILSDPKAFDSEMEELRTLAVTADETTLATRLAAQRLEDRQDYEAAFQKYMSLYAVDEESSIVRTDDSRIKVKLNEWVAGKLVDTWTAAPESVRTSLNPQVVAAAEKALSGDAAAQARFVQYFAFHPAAVPVMSSLVEKYAAAGEFLKAEILLLRMSNHSNAEVAANATERLARLLVEFRLPHDAAYFLERLAERFPDTKLANGLTGREHVEKLRSQNEGSLFEQPSPIAWNHIDIAVEASGTDHTNDVTFELQATGSRLPFFRNLRMQMLQSQERLSLINARDESLYWMVPLRQSENGQIGPQYPAQIWAHQIVLVHQDMLHCLSPVERRTLWTLPLDSRGQFAGYSRNASRDSTPKFSVASRMLSPYGIAQSRGGGMLAVANGNYVCVYGRRSFSVYDATTGRELWTCRDVAKNTRIYGTDDVLYILPQARSQAAAYRARDGKKLTEVEDVAKLVGKTIAISGNSLVQVESAASAKEAITVARRDPVTKTEYWSRQIPSKSNVAVIDEDSLAILDVTNGLSLINLDSGRETVLKFDESAVNALSQLRSTTDLFALSDPYAVYLIFNKRRQTQQYNINQLPSVTVNGSMFGFDRATGNQLWKVDVDEKVLITTHFDFSPILVLLSQRNQADGNTWYQTMSLMAIDKRTGRKYLDLTQPIQIGVTSFEINMADRFVELRMYDNRRYRLMAVEQVAGADTVVAPKPESATNRDDSAVAAPRPAARE